MFIELQAYNDIYFYIPVISVNPQPAGIFTTPRITTIPATTPNTGPFNCNFDQNFCSWTQDRTDDFDWKRKTGSTTTQNTGPTTDHSGSKIAHV